MKIIALKQFYFFFFEKIEYKYFIIKNYFEFKYYKYFIRITLNSSYIKFH